MRLRLTDLLCLFLIACNQEPGIVSKAQGEKKSVVVLATSDVGRENIGFAEADGFALSPEASPRQLAVADFNGDDVDDLAVCGRDGLKTWINVTPMGFFS